MSDKYEPEEILNIVNNRLIEITENKDTEIKHVIAAARAVSVNANSALSRDIERSNNEVTAEIARENLTLLQSNLRRQRKEAIDSGGIKPQVKREAPKADLPDFSFVKGEQSTEYETFDPDDILSAN